MTVSVQGVAPDFNAKAVMPDGSFKDLKLSDYRGKYVVLFFYPLDFTFVCPTEIVAFSTKIEEFQRRNCEVIGASVDSEFSHLAWRKLAPKDGGIGDIRYPIVADLTKSISQDYGVLLPGGIALRGLFLIDREGIVRYQVVNDLPLGRSVDETLRMVDALKFYEEHGELCPANWKPGAASIDPAGDKPQAFFAKEYSDAKSK